ncbi:MAG: flagellar protein FlgN [Gammaproteobacteria bacterium]|nr:flagellar protein FlgN [Gammaproteobacteria bacterium]
MPADAALAARAIIDSDRHGVERLHQLLLEERTALSARDATQLETIVQQKLLCLQALDANEAQRRRLLSRQQANDWPAMIRGLDATLAKDWGALLERLHEVAELGEINERIVKRSSRSTSRMLALLRGQIAPVGVYDRSGRTHACGDNRPITSA